MCAAAVDEETGEETGEPKYVAVIKVRMRYAVTALQWTGIWRFDYHVVVACVHHCRKKRTRRAM